MPINISEIQFDSSHLEKIIVNAVNKHINNTVNKFVENYNLYEETCNAVLKLPILSNKMNDDTKVNNSEIIKVDERASIIKNNNIYNNDIYLNLLDKYALLQSDMENTKREYELSRKKIDLLEKLVFELENRSTSSEEGCSDEDILEMKYILVKTEPVTKKIEENISIEIAEAKCEEEDTSNGIKKYEEILCVEKLPVKKPEEIVIEEEEEIKTEETQEEESEEELEEEVETEEEEEQVEEVETEEEEEQVEEVKTEETQEEEEQVETEEEDEVEEEQEVETEEEEQVETEEEEEEEVYEIEIKGKKYFTNNETNGIIYSVDTNGDPDEEIGHFLNSKPVFTKK